MRHAASWHRVWERRATTAGAALSLLLAVSAAAASPEASTQLPSGHWALEAAEDLQQLGWAEGYLPAQEAVPLALVRQLFEAAVLRARAQAPERAWLAESLLARLEEDFPRHASGPVWSSEARLSAGVTGRRRDLEAGSLSVLDVFLTRPVGTEGPDDTAPFAAAGVRAGVQDWLALSVEPRLARGELDLPRWEAAVARWNLQLSIGKGHVSYGPPDEQGIVLSGVQPVPRLELQTLNPITLPGPFRYIGRVALQAFVARIPEARHPGRPFLWGLNVRAQPHPRLTLDAYRGVMFGEGALEAQTSPVQVLKMVTGWKNQNENNVFGTSARWRLPTEAVLPLTVYGEWAADDLGAQFKVPGLKGGIRTVLLPGRTSLSLGGEFTFLGELCCRTLTWYTHHNHQGGWVYQDAPLGTPMGGNGREYRLLGELTLWDARLRVSADAFLRKRFEQNLYTPNRPGSSVGFNSRIRWHAARRLRLEVGAAVERGSGWRVDAFDASASAHF